MSHALVILCGGKSTRIGTDKALLPFGDCCLIEYLVRKFQPDFPKIYLSVQQKNDYAHLNLPVTTIGDIYGNAGPLSGIFSALSMISEERAFFISVDTPFVEPTLGLYLLSQPQEHPIWAIERANDQLETLSAVYSKSCIPQVGKAMLFHQYSFNRLHEKCNAGYIPEEELANICPVPLNEQFFNINTRTHYYHALKLLSERGELFDEDSNPELPATGNIVSFIPVVSLVGDSIIDKKTFCIQLLEALKKDGIKAAIFDSEKDFSNITNVDLILTCDLEDEDCFKIELLSSELNETLLHPLSGLVAIASDFGYKCEEVPCFDFRKPKSLLGFLKTLIRDYSH